MGKKPKTKHNNMAMRKERQFLFNGIMSKCKIINDLTSTHTSLKMIVQTYM